MIPYRLAAYQQLSKILRGGSYANIALKADPGASVQNRDRVTALVYETLDRLYYLDFLIDSYSSRSCRKEVRDLLRLGICELLFLHSPAYAVIDEFVSLSRKLGFSSSSGYVNAILRAVDRNRDSLPALPEDPMERMRILYSCPEWILSMWIRDYGMETAEGILASPKRPMQVRLQYPCDSEDPASLLPVPFERCSLDPNCLSLLEGIDPASLDAFREGRLTVQSEAAMLACRAAGDPSGRTVLDACAAPGGKSAYLFSLSRGTCRLTSLELHPHRSELMKKTFQRLGVAADVLCADASVPNAAFFQAFDIVLLDAPCSGLGLYHNKPDLRYSKSESDIRQLAAVQGKLLSVCADSVAPGGILIYCTCTISKAENEENVLRFLSERSDFRPDPVPIPIENGGMVQLLPNVHGTDGFFIARLVKCT